MFHDSTHKSHWIFESQRNLSRHRAEANASYCHRHSEEAIRHEYQFLTASEEQLLCQYYMKKLLEFCQHFRPPVPRSVLATVCSYFKRFYLHTSVMEYHPRNIQFCCAYIAFKTEEYNVTIDEFVQILPNDFQESIASLVLQNELLMLKKLKFHLIVHSPFRPVEGLIIDLKTRSDIENPDVLRTEADKFLLKSLHSDVSLLYPPSQLALSALCYSTKHNDMDLSSYIKSSLLCETSEQYYQLMCTLDSIEDIVTNVRIPDYQEVSHIEDRLKSMQSHSNISRPSPTRTLSVPLKRKSEEQLEDRMKRSKKDDCDEEPLLQESSNNQVLGIRKI